MSGIGAGDDETAAGFLVQPVHDAGTGDAANAAEATEAVEESIDHGAVFIAVRGVDDHPAGFIEHSEVGVFVEDIQGDVLRLSIGRFVGRNGAADGVTGVEVGAGFRGTSVNGDVTVFDESLDAGAGEVGEAGGEEFIEPGAPIRYLGSESEIHASLLRCGAVSFNLKAGMHRAESHLPRQRLSCIRGPNFSTYGTNLLLRPEPSACDRR